MDTGIVVVVRHGETEWSRSGRHTGRTDVPLTEAGRAAARELAPVLDGMQFDQVLCSPLLRARETCELAGFGDRSVLDDDLHEWDYGEYEGLTTPEIRAGRPDWNLWIDGCPRGEAPAEVGDRADRVLERVGAVSGATIVFAHGHILRVLSARWVEQPASFGARLALSAAAFGVLGHERETPVVQGWNARALPSSHG